MEIINKEKLRKFKFKVSIRIDLSWAIRWSSDRWGGSKLLGLIKFSRERDYHIDA